MTVKYCQSFAYHAAVIDVSDYMRREHVLPANKDYNLGFVLLLENNFTKRCQTLTVHKTEGGRPSLTHHIKIPLSGHGSVRRKVVDVEQRGQDCCASATGEGARALRQTTHTERLLPTAWHRICTAHNPLSTKLMCRYDHNIIESNVKPAYGWRVSNLKSYK